MSDPTQRVKALQAQVERGGLEKYHAANTAKGKMFVRARLAQLLDEGSFIEDAAFANSQAGDLPADGVITGLGRVNGRVVAIMANDSTVKAGSWGARTVEKIIRIQETAAKRRCPLLYLVDSAGARITDQVEMFPGRRGAGKIFYNQVNLSGVIPQICLLFGPSAAGGAYIPAFCDVVVMVNKNASMYLGSPRMAEMVIGEKVSLEEMGGARMHTGESGCGDVLVKTEVEALDWCKRYLGYLPANFSEAPPRAEAVEPSEARPLDALIPPEQNKLFDMMTVINALVDGGSFLEIKQRFAKELITGLARIDGHPVGVLANQPKQKGGVLFSDSADKAARFIHLCDAFNVPLLYLADVPGFMIGSKVERGGIIRHGAKMISAVSEATVPRISVVVRKAYGAGLYAMCGPGFEPDASLALPQAVIAVMGAEAAVNAVFANKIAQLPEDERAEYVAARRAEYLQDVDLIKLASELVVDAVIPGDVLRRELIQRFAMYREGYALPQRRKHGVTPV
ncbi:acyl-CoA carboxylase subunit beta [Myxococcota bacterium]|nr:acyl-CoA carboxylase subunit beta [Myxococcota bacterium]MBU1431297.1 acyl-CoA carboxylase subunit beta [Myxococcota bacterium]MBU1896944.1 acyl-CoA carboxylase subunit beta [Myxococcota bacterium]